MSDFEPISNGSQDQFASEITPSPDIYTIDEEGVISFTQESAFQIASHLWAKDTPKPEKNDYDEITGRNKEHAQEFALTKRTQNGDVTLTVSTHGAMAVGYQIQRGDTVHDILYGPKPAGSPFELDDKLRGGGLIGDPNASEDARISTDDKKKNFHGTLARSLTVPIYVDQEDGVAIFALSSNLIPDIIPHDKNDGVLTLVSYKLQNDGSYVTSLQTFNFGNKTIYRNDVFHPYVDTRESRPMGLQIGAKKYDFAKYIREHYPGKGIGPIVRAIKDIRKTGYFDSMMKYSKGISTEFPALTLFTQFFNVTLSPRRGLDKKRAHVGFWTQTTQYACLEVVEGKDEGFNPDDPKKVSQYTRIDPGTSALLAFSLEVQLA